MNLDGIIEKVANWESCAAQPNKVRDYYIAQAKQDIIKWALSKLPKKKYYDKETTNDYAQYSFQGFNQAITQAEENIKK